MAEAARKARAPALLLFAVFMAWPVLLVDPAGPSMADSVLLAAMRLVDDGTWTLSDASDPKEVFQTVAHDISLSGGRVYSGLGPGATLAAVPVYALTAPLLGTAGESVIASRRIRHYYLANARGLGLPPPAHFPRLYLLQIAMTWLVMAPLFAWFLVRLRARLLEGGIPHSQAMLVTLAAGFGTMAIFYSSMYSRQGLAYLILWHAVLALTAARPPGAWTAVAAGAATGLAVAIDYPALIMVALTLPFVLYRLESRRRIQVLLPVLAVLLLTGLYHLALFGSFFTTPYHHRFWHTAEALARRGIDLAAFQAGPTAGVGLPDPFVMARLCFGWYKGLFIYCPVLLLGVAGHLVGLKGALRRRLHVLSLLLFAAYLLFNSSLGSALSGYGHHFWGGLAVLWGPRYLVAVLPFLAWGILRLDWRSASIRWTAWSALALSILFNLTGAAFSHVMLSTPAFGEELGRPLQFALGLLVTRGPRVPLLDAYGTHPAIQAALFLTLLALTSVVVVRSVRIVPVAPER